MVHQLLGRYQLLEQIGSGGMGVVYLARDKRLGRDVAIKVLPEGFIKDEQARKRFRQEAVLISRLNHPNVGTIHDFDTEAGSDFLVMEYIPGESLDARVRKGPLTESEVRRLGLQLLKGLGAAHQAGLIHRDLKPGNLRVTPDGHLKILDFGLAKLIDDLHGREISTTVELLTQEGVALGTLPYMAPEQLRGLQLDGRTDLYAVGVVLYELTTGSRPFPEKNQADLIAAILNWQPEAPRSMNNTITPAFEQVVMRALEKSPSDRYQTTVEMAADLESSEVAGTLPNRVPNRFLSKEVLAGIVMGVVILVAVFDPAAMREKWFGSRPGQIQAMVILPLANRSGDPEDQYFVDGLTDELTDNLAQISTLKVISRTSASSYKGTTKKVPEIAKELKVDALIEGAVQRSGNKVRITVGLIAAKEDRQIWTETYEREEAQIIALQNDVVLDIAKEIHAKLTPQEQTRLNASPSVDPEAYKACLRARQALDEYTEQGIRKARELFKQALVFDPEYAPAYAGIADTYYSVSNIWAAPTDVIPLAKTAATKALELDQSLAEGHSSLGLLKAVYDWNWAEAEEEFKRALEINPNLASAHQNYAYILSAMGRSDEALHEYSVALDLDPLSVVVSTNLGWAYFWPRRYAEGIAHLEKTLRIDPNSYYPHPFLGLLYAESRNPVRAIQEMETTIHMEETTQGLAQTAYVYAKAGQPERAKGILKRLTDPQSHVFVPSYDLAVAYVGLGDREKAFRALEQAFAEKCESLIFMSVDPRLDPIRSDPRYTAMLRRLFPPAG